MEKKDIIDILNTYKEEVDNFNDAIFETMFEKVAEEILKLKK